MPSARKRLAARRTARDTANRALRADGAGAIEVAVDASVIDGVGAWAWAAADGSCGAGTAAADVVAAELEAIAAGLRAVCGLATERPARDQDPGTRVLSDSRAALDLIRRARTQGRGHEVPAIARALADALAALEQAPGRVELAHVRAHRGHPLNERAHALALGEARRGSASGPGRG